MVAQQSEHPSVPFSDLFSSMSVDYSVPIHERRNVPCVATLANDVSSEQSSHGLEAIMPADIHEAILSMPEKQTFDKGSIKNVAVRIPRSPRLSNSSLNGLNPDDNASATERATLWQRLKWGLILSLGGRESFSYVRRGDLKVAIAATLEVALMGSALVLTVGLQIQEVVGGRGGFDPGSGDPAARYIFVIASALSFALCFYSILTSSVLLLALSSCPSK